MADQGVALQLYTLRDEMKGDFEGTIRAVAEMGYPAVQPAFGYGDRSATDVAWLFAELGLKVAGSHVGFEQLESQLEREAEFILALGSSDLICPAIPGDRRPSSADGFRRFAADLDRVGTACRRLGIRFSYHCHDFEFVEFDGVYGMDLLLNGSDPANVQFEPDVFWIAVAGVDPAAYIRRWPGRCPMIHLKDASKERTRTSPFRAGAIPDYAPVGAGSIDFAAIFSASEAVGAEWYVVEQDACVGPALDAVRTSLENLRRWGKL